MSEKRIDILSDAIRFFVRNFGGQKNGEKVCDVLEELGYTIAWPSDEIFGEHTEIGTHIQPTNSGAEVDGYRVKMAILHHCPTAKVSWEYFESADSRNRAREIDAAEEVLGILQQYKNEGDFHRFAGYANSVIINICRQYPDIDELLSNDQGEKEREFLGCVKKIAAMVDQS